MVKNTWLGRLNPARLFTRNAEASGDSTWLAQRIQALLGSSSGRVVSTETALKVSAVLACARVIAEDTAIARLTVKTRGEGAGEHWTLQPDHWLARLFRRPNQWQTEFEFRSMLGLHAALTHGGFALKNYAGGVAGRVKELLPLPPNAVKPKQDKDWGLSYEITFPNGARETVPASSIFHLRGMTWDGVAGMDAVALAREAIGIAMATEDAHANLFKNGVKLSGILSQAPGAPVLSDERAINLAKQWKEQFGPDSGHQFGVAVLEGGMKFEPMAMTGVDAEHLATRRYQLEEICRGFRVHPQMIGHVDKASTFASAEQNMIAHVSHTLAPWVERWAQRIDRDLLTPNAEPNTWVSLDLRGLARGDAAARASFYNSGIHAGWMNRNEARELEGFERGPDELDEYLAPTQLAPGAGADAANAKNDAPSSGPN